MIIPKRRMERPPTLIMEVGEFLHFEKFEYALVFFKTNNSTLLVQKTMKIQFKCPLFGISIIFSIKKASKIYNFYMFSQNLAFPFSPTSLNAKRKQFSFAVHYFHRLSLSVHSLRPSPMAAKARGVFVVL